MKNILMLICFIPTFIFAVYFEIRIATPEEFSNRDLFRFEEFGDSVHISLPKSRKTSKESEESYCCFLYIYSKKLDTSIVYNVRPQDYIRKVTNSSDNMVFTISRDELQHAYIEFDICNQNYKDGGTHYFIDIEVAYLHWIEKQAKRSK